MSCLDNARAKMEELHTELADAICYQCRRTALALTAEEKQAVCKNCAVLEGIETLRKWAYLVGGLELADMLDKEGQKNNVK